MKPSQSEVLAQIVRQSATEIAEGHRDFVVHLVPRSLGVIEISLSHEEQAVVLKIAARLQRTEKLIESDIGRLRDAFETLLSQLAEDSA